MYKTVIWATDGSAGADTALGGGAPPGRAERRTDRRGPLRSALTGRAAA